MKKLIILFLTLSSCILFVLPMGQYLQSRPYLEKTGYIPESFILRLLAADQKKILAENLIFKVLTKSSEPTKKRQGANITYGYNNIFYILKGATQLDPYNMDAYYIAQSMVWDTKNVREINKLLAFGMLHRTWDGYLAFFAGFNSFYFIKDYSHAAKMFKRAEQLTNSPLFAGLSSRYMYEAGETDLAITYLQGMIKKAKNQTIRKKYSIRLQAFKEIKRIDQAVTMYRQHTGNTPKKIQLLVDEGYLQYPPIDPYHGTFYLDENGKSRTTSKFTPIKKMDNNVRNNH